MNKIFSIIISAITVLFLFALFIIPDSDFSEKENRKLAEFPQFSTAALLDGYYMQDISKYLNDQFPFRDCFMGIKTSCEKNIFRMKEINNIFICDDGYYIEEYTPAKNTEKISKQIDKFAAKINADIDFMLVPTASQLYSSKMPKFSVKKENIQLDDMQALFDAVKAGNITKINAEPVLNKNKDKYLFYRLDHHWTSYGAYLGYTEYCRAKGLKAESENDFKKEIISDSFYGTIYSKINDYSVKNGDVITAYSKPDWDIDVMFDDKPSKSIYNDEYLDQKDKYSYFLDNLHALTVIKNNKCQNGKKLAVVKDSFANCFVPFLIDHYEEIYVFDTRYYPDSVSEFINSNNITDVLLLFNMNSIDNETAINGLY